MLARLPAASCSSVLAPAVAGMLVLNVRELQLLHFQMKVPKSPADQNKDSAVAFRGCISRHHADVNLAYAVGFAKYRIGELIERRNK